MKLPEFQMLLPLATPLDLGHDSYEVWVDDSIGWQSVPKSGTYDKVRAVFYDGKADLDSIAKLEAHVLRSDLMKEGRYAIQLKRICTRHDPVRATAMERLRALARVIGGEE